MTLEKRIFSSILGEYVTFLNLSFTNIPVYRMMIWEKVLYYVLEYLYYIFIFI